jgi:predicted ABC-type ATPase
VSAGRTLSDEAIRDLGREAVYGDVYASARHEKPVAVIFGGQPGAGKSVAADDMADALVSQGGSVRIDADAMRSLLPYAESAQRGDEGFAQATQVDAGRMAQAAREFAISQRRNIIDEGTLRDPDSAMRLATKFREQGYRVELHVMAVNEQVSFVRAVSRYELAVETGTAPRWVDKAWHDEAVRGVAQSVKGVEEAGLADRIVVYDRFGEATRDTGRDRVGAADELRRVAAQLTGYERVKVAGGWDAIGEAMARRDAPAAEVDRIALARDRAHYSLRASKQASDAYDYENPSETHTSKESAARYARLLTDAFRGNKLDRAAQLPELVTAFAARAAAIKYAEANPSVPRLPFVEQVSRKIEAALVAGKVTDAMKVRAIDAPVADKAVSVGR